ncbi:MAG: PDZ domain-containing protein, partial [Candidatus Cloacimonas sp.]|nr:PDZ domain-containing protein [Candidatus Cloacimonas sp.]
MKKVLIVFAILSMALGSLMAGFPEGSNIMIKMNKEMNVATDSENAPYFGIFTEDLTFPKAQELGYTGTYGVLITGVVSGSPAWEYRLQEDDIILGIDKSEITNAAV